MASDGGSPLSPGVLESTSLLEDIIKEIARSPSQLDSESVQQELLRLYDLSRWGAGNAVVSRCLRCLKDPSEPASGKLAMMRVLDFLMDVKDGQLAEALSRELKFFVNIAKKTKEKERRKRRPTSVFSNKAAPEDIESILSITLELLDKWGRYYEAAGSPGGAKIVDAWKELTKENVRFPQGPAEYVFLTKPSASRDAGAFGFGSTGGGGGSSSFGGFGVEVSAPGSNSELSEPALQSLAAAVQSAVAQYGPGSPEAGEATAHFESMLAQWQHAAAEAVERGDMAAYEHFSAVAVRYAELQIGSPSASTENSRTFSGVSGVSPSPPDSDTVPESHSSSHKKHRRRKKEPQPDTFEVPPEVAMTPSFGHPGSDWAEADAAAAAYRAGEFGGSFGVGSSGFASDPGDSSDPFGAPSGAQGQGMSTEDFGGLAGGLSGSFPDAGMAQFGSQPGAYGAAGYDYGFNTGAFDAPGGQATQPSMDYDQQFARGADPNSFSGSASAMMAMAHGSGGVENFNKAPAPAPDAGPADLGPEEVDSEAAEAEEGGSRLRQLCERLQAEVEELKGQLQSSNSKELKAAQKRIKELERQQQRQEGQDSRDLTISALRETNMQTQAELDRRGLDLAAARRKAVEVEKRLSEKEEVFSDTCQRLVEAQQRVAQLEGELTHQREVETSLQNRLQGARAQQTVAEVELRQARHALSSATGLESDLQRRSVPYGSGSFAPRPSADLQAPDLNLSVSQADELASTVSAEKAPQSRFISADPESTREMPKAAPLPRSSPQTWMETPRIWQPVGALVRRLPPSHELTLRTSSHFRDLLLKQQGILYEDQQVLLALRSRVAPSTSTSSRRTIEFEATLSNRSGHQIHDVKLQPAADAHSVASRFDLQLQVRGRESAGHSSSMLWPQHQLHFDGKLEVFGVVDSSDGGPQVDLSYLLPDNQALRARLRLPLGATRLMAPAPSKPLAPLKALQLWDAPEFQHTEVSCICQLRTSLAGRMGAFAVWQALELGGALKCLPGAGGFRDALFGGCYVVGEPVDVLMRAELGPMPGEEAKTARASREELCRIAVRSTSHLVNRGVAQAAIDVLCDPVVRP